MQITEVKSIKRINVVAVILVKKKSFLISKRPRNKIYSGFWEFPGGKVETNESLKSALKREINEELDISIYEKDMAIFEIVIAKSSFGIELLSLSYEFFDNKNLIVLLSFWFFDFLITPFSSRYFNLLQRVLSGD